MAAKMNMTINREDESVAFNNAQIPYGAWRNFAGGPTRFDPRNTKRFFEIFLTDEEANRLSDLGWNVKWLEPRNPSEPKQAHLKIFVNYEVPRRYQPRIWMTRKKGDPILLDVEDLAQLDGDDITRAKLQIRPYDWELPTGTKGRKAMLKQMFVTIEEDDFGAEFFGGSEEENDLPFEE